MAKKIVIKLHKDRPSLVEDFTAWISKHQTSYGGGFYDGWDYEDEYYGLGFDWANNWGFPQEDDDEMDWFNQRQNILDWQEAYDKSIEEDDLEYENYWNRKAEESRRKKHNKRGGKRNRKRETIDDMVDDDNAPRLSEKEIDSILDTKKTIYYYPDINQESSVKTFKNLRSFFNFLDSEGIDISDNEGGKFIRSEIRHCCIDPLKRDTLGLNTIISDHSYGALAYEVSDDAAVFRD